VQAHPSLATIHAVFRGIGPFGPWRFPAINEKKSRSESRNHLNIRTSLFNGLPKNTRRCFLAGLALSGVLLDFLENSLPLAQAVSVSLCQAANIANGSSTRQHGQASKVLQPATQNTNAIYISTHVTKSKSTLKSEEIHHHHVILITFC